METAGTPPRVWIDWKEANRAHLAYDEPPENENQDARSEYIRADLVTALEWEMAELSALEMQHGAVIERLRAEQAQTVAANAVLAAENARLRDFIQELADAKTEVVKSPVDGEGYIEASYFWDWQNDAGKALAGKAGAP